MMIICQQSQVIKFCVRRSLYLTNSEMTIKPMLGPAVIPINLEFAQENFRAKFEQSLSQSVIHSATAIITIFILSPKRERERERERARERESVSVCAREKERERFSSSSPSDDRS